MTDINKKSIKRVLEDELIHSFITVELEKGVYSQIIFFDNNSVFQIMKYTDLNDIENSTFIQINNVGSKIIISNFRNAKMTSRVETPFYKDWWKDFI